MPLTLAGRNHIASAVVGEGVTPFNAANAFIGVGNSSAAFDSAHTDLQGGSKARKGMEAGYPSRNVNTLTLRALFGTADANFSWDEWGVFNAAAAGTMLTRKVEALGVKTNAQSWQITVDVPFALG